MKTNFYFLCLIFASFAISACGGSSGGGSAATSTVATTTTITATTTTTTNGSTTTTNGSTTTTTITANPNAASVSAVTAGNVMYSLASDFTVAGSGLDQGISVAVSGACSSVTEQAGSTPVKRVYSCKPSSVGIINVTVSSTNGSLLKSAAVTVPNPQVTMTTTKGTIVVELNPAKAPGTVNNFLTYVHEGFYSNTLFHRVVSGFVVQGGGFETSGLFKATHSPITLEPPSVTGLTNALGTIAMARTSDLNSATAQFYFNTVNNTFLDTSSGGYAVFGNVIQGMDVVKSIESAPTTDQTPISLMASVLSMTQTQ